MTRPRVFLGALLALTQAAMVGFAAPAPAGSATATSALLGARLAEPLVRTGPTTPSEDAAGSQAVTAFETRTSLDDFSGLAGFLDRYPHSGWSSAVGLDLGLSYLHAGYYSRALAVWRSSWELGKDSRDRKAKPAVDRAFGELVRLEAQLGRFDEVAALFAELGQRPISGSATEAVQQAREELVLVKKDPRHLYNCGPLALRFLQLERNPHDQAGAFLPFYRATPQGTSLAQLGGLAQRAGFAYRLIWRAPGSPIPAQGVMHLKLGHYAAIVGQSGARYRVEDTIFPSMSVVVTQTAIDSESSGYFLVPESLPLASGWRIVPPAEAGKVWGKGPSTSPPLANDQGANSGGGPSPNGQPGWPPNGTPKTGGPSAGSNGGGPKGANGCMCGYDIKESTVSVTLSDGPVGYTPPIGPAQTIRITYNQREDSQPATFSFYNVSPKWTLNWITYVTDDPANPGVSVSRYLPGGGAYIYTGFTASTGQFAAQNDDGGVLVLASSSPITYRRQLSDGSVEIYAQSNGATSFPRNIFLSQVIDPQGNALTLNYDSMMRVTSLTDATGRQTTVSYGLSGSPLLVTQITDPFGRSATFTYDSSGRLASITDVIGITSSMAYDANSLVNQLTTPYGTTSFAYTAPGTSGPPRFVQVTDPMGFHEREEWLEPAPIPDSDPAATVPAGMPVAPVNQFLTFRDSFFWNKDAYVAAGCSPTGGCDYTKARDTHYAHVPNTSFKSTTVESIKNPLENRIWYNTPAQTNSVFAGAYMQAAAVGRVLDDGSTQLYQYAYDTSGHFKLLQEIDPVGRITTYTYSNQVDLAAVAQTTAFGVRTTLAQFTYNTRHRPVLVTDAAGQTTTYAYNAAGQVTSATNPLGQTTGYHYNAAGDLTSVTNANNVTQASYTYDAFDRVATFTDSEGWIATYAYDSADRVTSISYLDGTADTYAYNLLDLASHTDRLGRTWRYGYDADQRLTSVTDPNGGQTLFGYNGQSEVTSRTDFAYASTVYNADSGLYLTTFRPYDPVAGRFLSRDPIGEDGDPAGNLYAYVGGDPVADRDPMGLWGFGLTIGGTAQVGAGYGAARTDSISIGVFGNGPDPRSLSVGLFSTEGSFAGRSSSPPCPNGENWALGAFAGGGAGGFATNANSVGDLAGPFKTASLNVGAGEVSGSLDLSKGRNSAGNEITESSLTFGPGIGISAAQMNTNTVVIFSSRR